MGSSLIVGPGAGQPHLATIIWLPGFTCDAHEIRRARLPRLRAALPVNALDCIRIVILCAPIRSISCYNGRRCHAWHDYFSDYGGTEGMPNTEERINVAHLQWARGQEHA